MDHCTFFTFLLPMSFHNNNYKGAMISTLEIFFMWSIITALPLSNSSTDYYQFDGKSEISEEMNFSTFLLDLTKKLGTRIKISHSTAKSSCFAVFPYTESVALAPPSELGRTFEGFLLDGLWRGFFPNMIITKQQLLLKLMSALEWHIFEKMGPST